MNTNDVMAIGTGLLFLVIVIPIVGGLMYARRERLLTHAERIKALEVGAAMPDHAATARIRAVMGQSRSHGDDSSESLARKCFSTALWVAFWGFAAAAGLGGAAVSAGVAYAIAASAGAIGVSAVICGTVLAWRIAPASGDAINRAKYETDDADALDVVACRG